MGMKRRDFLGLALGSALSTVDFLKYFRAHGVPGTKKELGVMEAAAATAAAPHYLIYWFCEGGWDGYSMFNPLDTSNDGTRVIPAGTLRPNPSWSAQTYRPRGWGTAPQNQPRIQGNISYGYLAQQGLPLFNDLSVVSSHQGSVFHSGSRWEYHYGKYGGDVPLSAVRQPDERTVMQAFCEAYGQSYLLPHVSWHRWLADGELSLSNFPEGTGYYEKLGPAWANTVYGLTPEGMRQRLTAIQALSSSLRGARVRAFVDNLHQSFIKDKNSESVKAFASAVAIYKSQVGGAPGLAPSNMFNNSTLLSDFKVSAQDLQTTSVVIDGNPARSKESPSANVQAMMTYELMTKGLSCGFFIESRDIRGFDSHRGRSSVFSNQGQTDQAYAINGSLWSPLNVLVSKLKNAVHPVTGQSYFNHTTIVLCSEMGRMVGADAASILASTASDSDKYVQIMDQDVCQHWYVSSCAFLGGNIKGNTQFGRVGTATMTYIPMMPDGTLDPAFNPVTGVLIPGRTASPSSFVSDAGHVYATALYAAGLNPTGRGRNVRPPMKFLTKSG